MLLRQSTAVVVQFGPFLDKTDAVTLETGLVSALDHGSTGVLLSKNGGTLTIRHASVTASSYDAYGDYKVTLDTTDTNTLGTLRMIFSEAATCLPVWMDFQVITANEWDSQCASAIRAVSVTTNNDKTGYGLSAAAVQAIWDALTSALTTASSIGKKLADWTLGTAQTGDSFARLGAPAGASVSADVAAVKVDTAAVKLQTDKLAFTVTNQVDANVLDWKSATAPAMTGDAFARIGVAGAGLTAITPPTATENADALLKRDMSAVTGEAARSPLNALRSWRNKAAVAGGTLTVYKENDSTVAWTAAVSTDAAALPITIVDPA